jgi:hypothetical protein
MLRYLSISDRGCDARSEALTAPVEEEQLEPFYELLEGSAGASEVATARSSPL